MVKLTLYLMVMRRFIPTTLRKRILIIAAVLLCLVASAFILGLTMQIRGGAYTVPAPKPFPTPLPKEAAMFEAEAAELEYVGRMVVYTAHLRLEVEDVDSAVDKVSRLAEKAGGFVASISTSKSGVRTVSYTHLTLPTN